MTLNVDINTVSKAELEAIAMLVLQAWDELGDELKSIFEAKSSSVQWKELMDVTQEDVIRTTSTLDDGDQTGVLNIDIKHEQYEGILIARHYCRAGHGYAAQFFMTKKEAFIDMYVENDAILKAMEIVRTAFDEFKALPEPKSEPEAESNA